MHNQFARFWVKVHITTAIPKLTDISRINVVVHVSDHFVDGKLHCVPIKT